MKHKNPQRKNIFEALYNWISKPLSRIIAKTFLTPNQITIISGIFGIIGAYLLTCHSSINLIYAAVFIQLFAILDLVDGDVARLKGMQSFFGQWLDIQFDKLNDVLIIFGMTYGLYNKTNNNYFLVLGMVLMGLIYLIQFSMARNSRIYKSAKNKVEKEKKNIINDFPQKILFIKKFHNFFQRHLLLEHCTFLFLVSAFCFINKIEIGFYILLFHALITYIYIIFFGFMIFRVRYIES